MKKMLTMTRIMFLPILLFLAACGGGGEGGGSAEGGAAGGGDTGVYTISGVAAAGAPLVGSVTLKDSFSPAKTKSTTIAGDGSFSIDVAGLTPPFIIKATGTVGSTAYTLHSFTHGGGTANVNLFTNLAVALASGGLDPASIYAAPSAGVMQTISSKLPVTITDIQTKLGVLLALYDAVKIDPFSSNFIANHTGLDEVLDMISVNLSSGVITIRNKATNDVIFTAPANNFTGGILDASKVPTPPVRAVISPIYATVSLSKSVTFTADVLRSTNKSVTWSVVGSGGGTITNAGVYTAPAIEGTYHVKATSVANPSLPAIAIVKVIPYNAIVAVTPASANISIGGSVTFTATVTGASNTAVSWTIVENSDAGIISPSIVFTEPSTAGIYHVKATSVADPSKSATATVTVSAPTPFPIGTWVGPNGFKFTVSQLINSSNLGVKQYSGIIYYPSLPGGSMNVSGTDSMVQIIVSIYDPLNNASLSVAGGQVAAPNFTEFSVGLTGSPISGTLRGAMTITSSNSAYNYFNMDAVFTKQ
jgi:hypothetical protein